MSNTIRIDLKPSNFALYVMHIYTTCIKKIKISLLKIIKKAPQFFPQNTPIILDVSKINYCNNWEDLYQTISNIGLRVIGVCSCRNSELKEIIIHSGLPILTKNSVQYENKSNFQHCLYEDNLKITHKTQIIYTPVRSGQKIYARHRDLIIIANVSSGAEIISDGNIHVYGNMRGRALAGASGDEESQIFCINLYPELISIGGHYWINDQIPQKFLGKSARLYLKNKTLIIKDFIE